MTKHLLSFFLVSCMCFFVKAQEPFIFKGIVTDASNKPLVGASVRESSKNGTLTDVNGRFQLRVKSENTVFEISYVGYVTQKVKYNNKDVVVVLKESPKSSLDEVVVVGVQRQSRKATTTAISSVSGKVLENMPAASADILLQGRVAGLNVQVTSAEPGVAPTVVVRGNSRVNTGIGDNTYVSEAQAMSGPLYIIDGIPVNPEDINGDSYTTGTNYLAGININDIESVDVQKDAAATAAWGSRGANGVIYIKTKRGKSAVPEFRVNAYYGMVSKPKLIKTYTGSEERRLKMSILDQYASMAKQDQLNNLPQLLTDSLNPHFNNATDWQGLFYQTGRIGNIDGTVSGANDLVNYRVNMNYYDDKGIIRQYGLKRYSLRGNFDLKITPKLNTQLIVGFSKNDKSSGKKFYNTDNNTPFSGSSQPTSFFLLNEFDSSTFTGVNSKVRNKHITDYYTISATVNYAIRHDLRYTFQGSMNQTVSNVDYFSPSNIDAIIVGNSDAFNKPAVQPSYAESDRRNYTTYFMSNNVNYAKKLFSGKNGTHNLVITAAQQFTSDVSSGNSAAGYNVPSNDISVVTGIPQTDLSASSYYSKDGLLSIMGQVQYDYNKKYLLYLSYRGDASSRFGKDSKWGYFPAIGTGWLVSDEKFMQNLKERNIINYLKIRATWGISGSQSGDFYAPYNSYIVPGTYDGNAAIQPSYNNGLTKDDLTWARTEQKNLGIDVYFLNSRINVTADIYDKISKDDYYNFMLPFYTGFSKISFNAHDLWVSNRGVDLSINTRNLSNASKLQWNTQLVLSYNKNAIARLPNNNRTFVVNDGYGYARLFAVGQPIYELYQMKYEGVYNNSNEIPFNPLTGKAITYFKGSHKVQPGDPIWEDVNGDYDVWTDEDNGDQYGDRIPMGNPNPKFTGGLTNDFTYKNFSLTIFCTFTWKRTVVNTFQQQQFNNFGGSLEKFANRRLPILDGIDYWTPEKAKDPGYAANFPAINPFAGYYSQFWPFSSMWNVDGSYFKVKTVILGYQLPLAISKRLFLKNVRAYAMFDNLLILKNKNNTMPDPESVNQLGVYSGGLYPQPRKFTFGLDIQF